ncbi:MAG: VOC family protein [Actinomycetota bacterium]
MPAPVTHLEILGPDRQALAEFYGGVFGWSLTPIDEMNYTLFAAAEGGIGGGLGKPESGDPSVSVYAEIDDLDAKLALADELGATDTMGPIPLSPDSRIGMFRDPAGLVFGLYEGPSDSEEAAKGQGAAVVWFDLIGAPADTQRDFYAKLLGWEYEITGDYAHIKKGDRGIAGGITAPMPGMPEKAIVAYIETPDIDATLSKIEAAGGRKVLGRTSVGENLAVALFADVAGNLNGLVTRG